VIDAAASIFRIDDLEQHYGGRCVLRVPALEIGAGSIVGLMGPNGSGKSTLLRLLGFIEAPTRGRIDFKGAPAAPFDPRVRGRVTLLPQDPYLMRRTVYDNVAYGLRIRSDPPPRRDKVHAALNTVGLVPAVFARRPWYALSGGEAQRAALAARLALEPEVLLMDEPTASVDAASAERIRQAALAVRQNRGTTLVVASHDWQWLFEVCDEIWHFHGGEVFRTGTRTIFPGPWQAGADGMWRRPLIDGQQLIAPPGSDPLASAFIESEKLSLGAVPAAAAKGRVTLEGTVLRLALIRRTARVVVTVGVGELTLTQLLDAQAVKAAGIVPGDRVGVVYAPDALHWLKTN
jgi:tungstate transport system ATP-binding protein